MSKETKTPPTPSSDSAVVAKLKKYKAQREGSENTTLPETGVTVTWPKFKSHGIWMKAQRLAKGKPEGAMNIYLTLMCKFDGEKLTLTEFKELVPTDDVMHLLDKVMGGVIDDEESEDDEGNVLH